MEQNSEPNETKKKINICNYRVHSDFLFSKRYILTQDKEEDYNLNVTEIIGSLDNANYFSVIILTP